MPWHGEFAYELNEGGFHSRTAGVPPEEATVEGGFVVAPIAGGCTVIHYEQYVLAPWLRPIKPVVRMYLRWTMRRELPRPRSARAAVAVGPTGTRQRMTTMTRMKKPTNVSRADLSVALLLDEAVIYTELGSARSRGKARADVRATGVRLNSAVARKPRPMRANVIASGTETTVATSPSPPLLARMPAPVTTIPEAGTSGVVRAFTGRGRLLDCFDDRQRDFLFALTRGDPLVDLVLNGRRRDLLPHAIRIWT